MDHASKPHVPCGGCQDRHENCHSVCGKYTEYRIQMNNYNKIVRANKQKYQRYL